MVETANTTTSTVTSRLITFEMDRNERLVIGAGRGELVNRINYEGDYIEIGDIVPSPNPRVQHGR